jgi:hypothetical protein
MSGFIEQSERLHNPKYESGEIISQFIHPGYRVAVIGPARSIIDDSSTLAVADLLTHLGQLYIVDPRETFNIRTDPLQASGPCVGIGDVMRYMTELEYFHSNGLDIPIPVWLGNTYGIFNLSQSPFMKDLDVIYDHTTAAFIANGFSKDGRLSQNVIDKFGWSVEVFSKSLTEYHEALKDHGLLILQTEKGCVIEKYYDVLNLMNTCGFRAIRYHVDDTFRIPLKPETISALYKLYVYSSDELCTRSLDYLLSLIYQIENNGGNDILVCGAAIKKHSNCYHEAPNLYIAIKV